MLQIFLLCSVMAERGDGGEKRFVLFGEGVITGDIYGELELDVPECFLQAPKIGKGR